MICIVLTISILGIVLIRFFEDVQGGAFLDGFKMLYTVIILIYLIIKLI